MLQTAVPHEALAGSFWSEQRAAGLDLPFENVMDNFWPEAAEILKQFCNDLRQEDLKM